VARPLRTRTAVYYFLLPLLGTVYQCLPLPAGLNWDILRRRVIASGDATPLNAHALLARDD